MSKQDRMPIAQDFIDQGHFISKVLKILKIPSSSFYYMPVCSGKSKGIQKSIYTKTNTGQDISNTQVVAEIESLLEQEFVDYGYRKVTHWLRQNKGYIINEKELYLLMGENSMLNKKVAIKRSPRVWLKELVPNPTQVMEYLEFDIKYVYVDAKRRNALVLTVIDVSSRWVLGHYIDWKINEYNVRELFEKIFSHYELPKNMFVRNDNATRLIESSVLLILPSY